MLRHERLNDGRMAGIEAVLGACAWREMTARAVALRLVCEIEGEAVAVDDDRVWVVERALSACRWRGLTLAGVAGEAAAALEVWDAGCRRLELELAKLLDSAGDATCQPGSSVLGDPMSAAGGEHDRTRSRTGVSRCRSTNIRQARRFRV